MPAKKSKSKKKSGKKGGAGTSGTHRAGITFAPSRVNRMFKKGRFAKNHSGLSGVFLAGVLEYLCAEVLEVAGDVAREHQKKTIAPKHLNLAVRSDADLSKLLCLATIPESGVPANIDDALLPKKKGKAAGSASPKKSKKSKSKSKSPKKHR